MLFTPFNRRDYRHQYSDRPLPKVPDYRNAPKLTGDLDETLEYLQATAGTSDDFAIRRTVVNHKQAILVYYQTIANEQQVESVLHALQLHPYPRVSSKELPYYLTRNVISVGNTVLDNNFWKIRESLSRGSIILFVEGMRVAITLGAKNLPHRALEPALLESSTRGPQVAFIENIDVNIGLMRWALENDTLTVKQFTVGYRSRNRVAVLYQHDVANPLLVDTVTKRIEAVHVDKLTGSATLEQRIIDNHWTLFPQTRATTRVDNCVKEVGQGKVLILVDGDPTALLAPGTIVDFFQTMEDDQHSWWEATTVRWLRMVSFVLAFYLPALYISFVDFNPELMPQNLALQIARSREGVPFNAATEVMMMQLVIEIIREAALRMPKAMGQTIGIVGGLVLGQAAVEAGLVSNILIVVIALTAVALFVLPSYEFSTVLRILSWLNIIGASIFGFYGVMLVVMLILFHVGSLKSFGIPYLDPISGVHGRDFFLDGVVRFPLAMLDKRAEHYHDQEVTRAADYTDPVEHPVLEKVSQNRSRQ
ncbi:spore germination protein [Alicyclobacillus mengziensis]|uniref:Spore germination protein n=1 Tax=Alicyclobacillus mengziensis TaxID=2931921 RepID=A0A9X7W064_9BACL|nr:spore germination protein [Alicyclobacillus mengziensis]QSO48251.1 spore germination protein [Alicyclobacillus mengziensis]